MLDPMERVESIDVAWVGEGRSGRGGSLLMESAESNREDEAIEVEELPASPEADPGLETPKKALAVDAAPPSAAFRVFMGGELESLLRHLLFFPSTAEGEGERLRARKERCFEPSVDEEARGVDGSTGVRGASVCVEEPASKFSTSGPTLACSFFLFSSASLCCCSSCSNNDSRIASIIMSYRQTGLSASASVLSKTTNLLQILSLHAHVLFKTRYGGLYSPTGSSAAASILLNLFGRESVHTTTGNTHRNESVADLSHNDAPVGPSCNGSSDGRELGLPVGANVI